MVHQVLLNQCFSNLVNMKINWGQGGGLVKSAYLWVPLLKIIFQYILDKVSESGFLTSVTTDLDINGL